LSGTRPKASLRLAIGDWITRTLGEEPTGEERLFCLLADVEIRRQTNNQKGLEHALRGILAAGGDIRKEWNLEDALRIGDSTVGANVLGPLYATMKDKPVSVDLDSLWTQLGVQSDGASVRLDDSATLAAIRRAITTRESAAAAADPSFFKSLAVFVSTAVGLRDRPSQVNRDSGVVSLDDNERRTISSRFETGARGHRAMRSHLPGQTWQPRKGSRSDPTGGKAGARSSRSARTWLPGYPAWLDVCPGAALWENASAKDVFARLRSNASSFPVTK